jgi:leucyl-tRNA---protein transferase
MFHFHLRKEIKTQYLDYYLANAWFRRGDHVFTTDEEHFDNSSLKIHWIRYDLHKLNLTREAKEILYLNSEFSSICTTRGVTKEREELFAAYKTIVSYYEGWSLAEALAGDDIFASAAIEVYSGSQLIGAAHFDFANECIAGIRNYYDPAFKHLNLGKYLMLQQIQWGINSGKQYFYPGYVVEYYPKMNYKLFACKESVEYYDWHLDTWLQLNTSAFRRKGYM